VIAGDQRTGLNSGAIKCPEARAQDPGALIEALSEEFRPMIALGGSSGSLCARKNGVTPFMAIACIQE